MQDRDLTEPERLVIAHLRREPHPICQWCIENEAWVRRVKDLEDAR